jgi:hypothetical protein
MFGVNLSIFLNSSFITKCQGLYQLLSEKMFILFYQRTFPEHKILLILS